MVKRLSDFSWRYVLWRTDRNNDCLAHSLMVFMPPAILVTYILNQIPALKNDSLLMLATQLLICFLFNALYPLYVKHYTPKYKLRIPVYYDYDAEEWRWLE